MAKPYSEDLRRRVVEAIDSGATIPDAAEQCGVSISSVVRPAMAPAPAAHRGAAVSDGPDFDCRHARPRSRPAHTRRERDFTAVADEGILAQRLAQPVKRLGVGFAGPGSRNASPKAGLPASRATAARARCRPSMPAGRPASCWAGRRVRPAQTARSGLAIARSARLNFGSGTPFISIPAGIRDSRTAPSEAGDSAFFTAQPQD
jgi:hypothetical protein